MEHVHSIILIKRGDKYLNYFDERWGMYLFPNIKTTAKIGNNVSPDIYLFILSILVLSFL